jgi:hypothetical protein
MHIISRTKNSTSIGFEYCNDSKLQAKINSETKFTKHATIRIQQRGVSYEVIGVILDYADLDNDIGSGCYSIWISKRRLRDRALRSKLGSALDRAAGITLVISGDSGEVVTVMHDHGGKRGRRYRRPN